MPIALVPRILCGIVLLIAPSLAQGPFPTTELATPIATQLASLDDVEVLANGDIVVSRPNLGTIGVIDPVTGGYTPYPFTASIPGALAFAPDGHLYFGDSGPGTVVRYDIVNHVTTTVANGFFIPLEVVFTSPTDMYVCNLTSTDFFFGTCEVWHVDLSQPSPTPTLVLDGIIGAADIEFIGDMMFVGSLGTPLLGTFNIMTGVAGVAVSGIIRPSDIVVLDQDTLLLSALLDARVVLVDLPTGTITELASSLGSLGQGAEDLAIDTNGDALLTLNTGELFRLDLTSKLRQIGNASVGQPVQLRLESPAVAGFQYSILMSASANTGFAIGGQVIPIDLDALFVMTDPPRPPQLVDFDGTLDAAGVAFATQYTPAIPSLAGFPVFIAAAIYDIAAPLPLLDITNTLKMTFVP